MKIFPALTLLLMITAYPVVGVFGQGSGVPLIGNLKNSNFEDGCSCSFRFNKKSKGFIFMGGLGTAKDGSKGPAWMNIDGQDTKLKFISSTRRTGSRQKKGDQYTEKYVANGITVQVGYVIVKPSGPGEEVTDYAATIIVTKGTRTQAVKVVGDCGC